MADAKQAWDEVGEQFGRLGQRLKQTYERQAAAGSEGGPRPDERDIEEAFRTLAGAVNTAVGSAGAAMRDPAFGEDVKSAARAFGDALSATFEDLGNELRRRLGSGSDRPEPPAGPPPGLPPSGGPSGPGSSG